MNRQPEIIIIDDDEVLNEVLSLYLSEHFGVTTFSNPEDALDFMKYAKVDGVVMDFHLRGIKGDKVLTQIREEHECLPVVCLSGDPEAEALIGQSDYNLFLPKPIGCAILIKKLSEMIESAWVQESGLTRASSFQIPNTENEMLSRLVTRRH